MNNTFDKTIPQEFDVIEFNNLLKDVNKTYNINDKITSSINKLKSNNYFHQLYNLATDYAITRDKININDLNVNYTSLSHDVGFKNELMSNPLLKSSFISSNIQECLYKKIQSRFDINYNYKYYLDRPETTYYLTIYSENDPNKDYNLNETIRKLAYDIIRRIIFLVQYVINSSNSSNTTSVNIPRFTIFLCSNKKEIPNLVHNKIVFKPDNVNSALTNGEEIIIFRSEELLKSILHELIHALKIDFLFWDYNNYSQNKNYAFKSIFNINPSNELRISEAYSEFLANILNILIVITHKIKFKPYKYVIEDYTQKRQTRLNTTRKSITQKGGSLKKSKRPKKTKKVKKTRKSKTHSKMVKKMIKSNKKQELLFNSILETLLIQEFAFSVFQASKIIRIVNIFNEFVLNQTTSVLSYYILKLILMFNISEMLDILNPDMKNKHLVNLIFNKIGNNLDTRFEKFHKIINEESALTMRDTLNSLSNEIDILKNIKTDASKNSASINNNILRSMRMTSVGI